MVRALINYFLLFVVAVTMSSCTKKKSKSSSSNSDGSGEAAPTAIGGLKAFPTSQGVTWTPIQSADRYYIKGLDLTVSGVCTGNVATIKVDEGGTPYSESATCDKSGSFSWNKIFTSSEEGDKTLTFTAYDVDGLALFGITAVLAIRIDNTAPTAPVITAPASSSFQQTDSNGVYTIMGTATSDVTKLTGPGGAEITVSGGVWSYDAILVDGSSLDFSFYTFDLAGNQSAATTQTILWRPTISVPVAGSFPGDSATDSGTNFKIEASAHQSSSSSTDVGSNFTLETGFNYLINKVRGL